MSDDLETPTDVNDDESSVIRELREKARKFDEAQSTSDRLQRENVVLRAGLSDLSEKQIKALSAAHEGEWEVDAIKATASELGFGKQPESSDSPKVPQAELDAMQRVQDAGNSEPAPPPADIDGVINGEYASLEEFDAALRNAGLLQVTNDL